MGIKLDVIELELALISGNFVKGIDKAVSLTKVATKTITDSWNGVTKAFDNLAAASDKYHKKLQSEIDRTSKSGDMLYESMARGFEKTSPYQEKLIKQLREEEALMRNLESAANRVGEELGKWDKRGAPADSWKLWGAKKLDKWVLGDDVLTGKAAANAKRLKGEGARAASGLDDVSEELHTMGMSDKEKAQYEIDQKVLEFEKEINKEGGVRATWGKDVAEQAIDQYRTDLMALQAEKERVEAAAKLAKQLEEINAARHGAEQELGAMKKQNDLLAERTPFNEEEIAHKQKMLDYGNSIKDLAEADQELLYQSYEIELKRQEQADRDLATAKERVAQQKQLNELLQSNADSRYSAGMTPEEKADFELEQKLKAQGMNPDDVQAAVADQKSTREHNKPIEESKQAALDMAKEMVRLNQEIATTGMDPQQKAMYEINELLKKRIDLTEEEKQMQRDIAESRIKDLETAKAKADIDKINKDMLKESTQLGKTAEEIALMEYEEKLKKLGLTQEEYDMEVALKKNQIDYAWAVKKGDDIAKAAQTPEEKYAKEVEQLKKIRELRGDSWEKEYQQAMTKAQEDLDKADLKTVVQVQWDNQLVRKGSAEYDKILGSVANRKAIADKQGARVGTAVTTTATPATAGGAPVNGISDDGQQTKTLLERIADAVESEAEKPLVTLTTGALA